jgi:hypothetical protein
MKKRIITLAELRKENPFLAGKVITALQRNQVKPKPKPKKNVNFSKQFSSNDITQYIISNILNN